MNYATKTFFINGMENVNQIIRKKIVNKKNWKKNNEQKMHT